MLCLPCAGCRRGTRLETKTVASVYLYSGIRPKVNLHSHAPVVPLDVLLRGLDLAVVDPVPLVGVDLRDAGLIANR